MKKQKASSRVLVSFRVHAGRRYHTATVWGERVRIYASDMRLAGAPTSNYRLTISRDPKGPWRFAQTGIWSLPYVVRLNTGYGFSACYLADGGLRDGTRLRVTFRRLP